MSELWRDKVVTFLLGHSVVFAQSGMFRQPALILPLEGTQTG